MLVSHDRALLREVCDEFWLVAGGVLGRSTATSTTTARLLEQSKAAARSARSSGEVPARGRIRRRGSPGPRIDRKAAAAARLQRADAPKPRRRS